LSEERREGDSDSDHDSGNDEPTESVPEVTFGKERPSANK